MIPMHKAMSMQMFLQSNNDLSPLVLKDSSFQSNQASKSKKDQRKAKSKSFALKNMSSNEKFKQLMSNHQKQVKSCDLLKENIKRLKYQTSLAKTWEK